MQVMKIVSKTLSNGLRVVLIEQRDAVTVTMMTLIGTGSNKETKRQNGLSHFLEHVCFKATPTRPNALIINEQFEEIGAITNAFTSDEYTGYFGKSHPRHINTLIELVGDIVINASLPAEELEKEKGVIIEEINMYEDMPQAKVLELLSAQLYGDTPAGRTVIGTKDSVKSFTRNDVVKYKQHYYNAKNTVVVVVGAFDGVSVLSEIKKTFAQFPRGEQDKNAVVAFTKKTPQVLAFTKTIDQTHIALGFPSFPIDHPDGATLSLLATLLGGGMSSKLFHHLREELGVAYYVRAEHDAHSTYGEFVITAGIDTARSSEVLEAIITILRTSKQELVSEKELSKAREYSIGMLGMGLEATDMVAGFVSTQLLLTGKIKTPEIMAKEYMKVTPADIIWVANIVFDPKKARLAIVGPATDTKALEPLLTAL